MPTDKYKAIDNLSDSVKDFSDALNDVNLEAIDKLSSISQGVMLVSIIDDIKLKSVLDTISERKDELREIYGEAENENIFDKASKLFNGILSDDDKKNEKDEVKTTHTTSDSLDNDTIKYYNDINDISKNIKEIKNYLLSSNKSTPFA